MVIVETRVFTRRIVEILSDEDYRSLQFFLTAHPDAGDIIPGSGGLRKLRWKTTGHGKRGGTRVIYYWWRPKETILMLFAFRKSERSDLTRPQLKKLKEIVGRELQ